MAEPAGSGGTASQTALALIRDRISSGQFPANSRLPREIELAVELGVSRSALREAIRALELVGVLASKHGSGTYVTSLRPRDLMRGLDFINPFLAVDSAVELVEFRRVVEPAACALATERATADEKTAIRALFETMEETTDPAQYARLDSEFHQAILGVSGNSILIAVSQALTYGSASRTMWRVVTQDAIPERTRREHEALVLAIETGDRDLALATAHAHIAAAQAVIGQASPPTTPPEPRPVPAT
ncbi:FadR/GntR family transcriptional regulator [Pengzhenrongella sp.]|jgi:DNA-binding FadR family transcriptional regulator|uniref:FadR/GntR family transcriptional regulator n=1 Tax=Pengzhenrongella sp. TaxID=2888820 RepID=UPI002F93C7FE